MIKHSGDAPEKIADFFSSYPELVYARGETILRAEDAPQGAYFLKKGCVHQYIISSSGETFMVHLYKPGSFFPLMWIVNDEPNTYYYDSITVTKVLHAPKEDFCRFLKKNPDVLYYAMQRICAGLSGLVTRMGQLVLDNAYKKTILLLLYYAKNFGETTSDGTRIVFPLAHREMANWIGTTRETASLQVELLIRKGLLATHGRLLVIRSMRALHKELDA